MWWKWLVMKKIFQQNLLRIKELWKMWKYFEKKCCKVLRILKICVPLQRFWKGGKHWRFFEKLLNKNGKAQVVKLVDTLLWGGSDECVMQVRLLSWAPKRIREVPPAHVVKLVNTLHSGCSERTLLEVRVFSWAQRNKSAFVDFFCFKIEILCRICRQ